MKEVAKRTDFTIKTLNALILTKLDTLWNKTVSVKREKGERKGCMKHP